MGTTNNECQYGEARKGRMSHDDRCPACGERQRDHVRECSCCGETIQAKDVERLAGDRLSLWCDLCHEASDV